MLKRLSLLLILALVLAGCSESHQAHNDATPTGDGAVASCDVVTEADAAEDTEIESCAVDPGEDDTIAGDLFGLGIDTRINEAATNDSPHDMHSMEVSGGGVSAAYMVIRNAGDEDDALISAETDAADRVEMHQTLIDANGVASMTPQESIVVPAVSDVMLMPASYHLMLVDLATPLEAGDTITLVLTFESGAQIEIEAAVQDTPPDDAAVTVGNLTIENAWVRPG